MSVVLRSLEQTDVETLLQLANSPAVADGMTTLPVPFKLSDAEDLIIRSKSPEEVIRGIIEEDSGQLCGIVMLRDFEIRHEQAELSIRIGEKFWGRGLGTAAIREMANIGFLEKGLNRIYAYCMVRNSASQRILEKSGFSREGLLRERVIKNGIYEDVYIYALLRNDLS